MSFQAIQDSTHVWHLHENGRASQTGRVPSIGTSDNLKGQSLVNMVCGQSHYTNNSNTEYRPRYYDETNREDAIWRAWGEMQCYRFVPEFKPSHYGRNTEILHPAGKTIHPSKTSLEYMA
ncbi:hypothetical protein AVEN_196739-1 [Araneus ventricosus]|uniref:Uncharacterized protein n=1 Tax=Araneus ventricosus TaxID=182803 RepID=A0A4Y2HA17_ARAVE|nr:hypothetical protein AVEN_196739-1 [Araneus ventricosus]